MQHPRPALAIRERIEALGTVSARSPKWRRGTVPTVRRRLQVMRHAHREWKDNDIKLPIYMDNHATTPVDPRVVEAMLPYFTEHFGNAASRNHAFGWEAEEAVETARKQVAELIGAMRQGSRLHQRRHRVEQPRDQGRRRDVPREGQPHHHLRDRAQGGARHLQAARARGLRVTYLPVQKDGRVDLDELRATRSPTRPILVSVMAANNEIGVLQPIAEIGAIAKEKGVLFHTDAVQAAGKMPFDVNDEGSTSRR